jgi:hypothetical protein
VYNKSNDKDEIGRLEQYSKPNLTYKVKYGSEKERFTSKVMRPF